MKQKKEICDNCRGDDQATVNHGSESWCLDCMRLAGHCISCDADIRELVDDYFMYEDDRCPNCAKEEDKFFNQQTQI